MNESTYLYSQGTANFIIMQLLLRLTQCKFLQKYKKNMTLPKINKENTILCADFTISANNGTLKREREPK